MKSILAAARNDTICYSTVNDEDICSNAHQYLTLKEDLGFGSSRDTLASTLFNASQEDASALSTRLSDPAAYLFFLIGCLGWTRKAFLTLLGTPAQQTITKEYAPLTQGVSQVWQLQHACLGWLVRTQNPPKKLNVKTNTTILLTQCTADSSTGFSWALGLLEEIKNKILVLRKGDGHTNLSSDGKTVETIVEYLITGRAPSPGLVLDS